MSKFWENSTIDSDNSSTSSSKTDDGDDDSSCWDTTSWSTSSTLEEEENSSLSEYSQNIFLDTDKKNIIIREEKEEKFSSSSLDQNIIWKSIRSEQIDCNALRRRDNFTATTTTQKRKKYTRIVCISDTHGQHREGLPFLPKGDVLIHAGDFTKSGESGTVQDMGSFFHDQRKRYEQIICIAGNHDITFHDDYYYKPDSRCFQKKKKKNTSLPADLPRIKSSLTNHCTYLQDSSSFLNTTSSYKDNDYDYENEGDEMTSPTINAKSEVYGSPWTPSFYNWAFNLDRGPPIRQVWSNIPASTDVLITHGPPLGRCDQTSSCSDKQHVGCYDLLNEIQTRIRPRLHVFGHVHSGYGTSFDGTTLYANASILDTNDEPTNRCIVIDLPHDQSQPACIVEPECKIQNFTSWLLLQEKKHQQNVGDDNGNNNHQKYCYKELIKYVATTGKRANINEDFSLLSQLPSKNELLQVSSAFSSLCDIFCLHRDKVARNELHRALCQIHAESFSSSW